MSAQIGEDANQANQVRLTNHLYDHIPSGETSKKTLAAAGTNSFSSLSFTLHDDVRAVLLKIPSGGDDVNIRFDEATADADDFLVEAADTPIRIAGKKADLQKVRIYCAATGTVYLSQQILEQKG